MKVKRGANEFSIISDEGSVLVLNSKSKQLMFELKSTQGKIIDTSLSGDRMYSLTQSGILETWDLGQR